MLKKKLQEICKPSPEHEKLNQTLDRSNRTLGAAVERLRERLREREKKTTVAA